MPSSDFSRFTPDSPEAYLAFAQPGVQQKTLHKLKRGQFTIAASLDLHGCTVLQAEDALNAFLVESLLDQLRTLLIIHGKGTHAILKNHVHRYLEENPAVLAFCSAKQKDGGLGAVYVLLKKQKGSDNHEEE